MIKTGQSMYTFMYALSGFLLFSAIQLFSGIP